MQGGCATYQQGLKTGVCQGWGGGGGWSAYYGINRAEGGIKGGNGRRCGGWGGGGGWDKHPGGILGGGGRRDKHAGGIPGGEGGANTIAASPPGGGLGQTPWCNPTTPTRRRVRILQGQGGGRLGTTIKGKQVGGIAKRCEKR